MVQGSWYYYHFKVGGEGLSMVARVQVSHNQQSHANPHRGLKKYKLQNTDSNLFIISPKRKKWQDSSRKLHKCQDNPKWTLSSKEQLKA